GCDRAWKPAGDRAHFAPRDQGNDPESCGQCRAGSAAKVYFQERVQRLGDCGIPSGTWASTVTPRPVDATVMVPPNASTRSRIPIMPKPCLWSAGKPAPLSRTLTLVAPVPANPV